MNHGGFQSNDWPNRLQYLRVAVNGAGAAAPVAPAGLTAVQPDYPVQANCLSRLAAEIPTRSGVGVYVLTFGADFKLQNLLNASVELFGAAGGWGQVSLLSAANRQITLRTFAAAGAATDLLSTDLCIVTLCGIDGKVT
jgi:hypothetical protein